MTESKTDELIQAIDRLTRATIEVAIKIKRATSNNPFLNGEWQRMKDNEEY